MEGALDPCPSPEGQNSPGSFWAYSLIPPTYLCRNCAPQKLLLSPPLVRIPTPALSGQNVGSQAVEAPDIFTG